MNTPFQINAAIQDLQQRMRALEKTVGVGREDKGIPPPEKPPPATESTEAKTENETPGPALADAKTTEGPPPPPARPRNVPPIP